MKIPTAVILILLASSFVIPSFADSWRPGASDVASPAFEPAAAEFMSYCRKMSADVPATDCVRFELGAHAGARLEADGTLHVFGRSPDEVLYASRRLLERRFGVRWLRMPTDEDDGEYVPNGLPELAPFNDDYTPHFPMRRLDITGVRPKVPPEKELRFVDRLGFQTQGPLICGGLGPLVAAVPESLYDEHPEYFALVGGKRVKGRRFCYSNPAVAQRLRDCLMARLEKAGGRGMIWISQHDAVPGRCECAACRVMDGSPDEHEGNASTRFLKMVSAAVPTVFEKYPEAELVVWAHSSYRKPPVGFKPDPRLKVWYFPHGRCYGHALDDPRCRRNAQYFDWLKGWCAVSTNVFLYNHLTCTPFFYGCCEEVEARDIALYNRLGVIGWKNEISFPRGIETYGSNWQWLYMVSRLLADPTLDARSVVDEAERLYYGPTYPAMSKYHAYRRELWKTSDTCLGYPYGDPRRPALLNEPGAKERLLALLDEAEAREGCELRVTSFECQPSTPNSQLSTFNPQLPTCYKHRVAQDRRWLTEYWIKPNEQLRELERHAVTVPESADWTKAAVVCDFYLTASKPPRSLPDALKTVARFRHDGTNLLMRVDVGEPSMDKMVFGKDSDPAWKNDSIELMVVPPGDQSRWLQFCVDARGHLYSSLQPEGGAVDFGAVAFARQTAKGYEVELSVPLAAFAGATGGWDGCRFLIGRSRHIRDEAFPNGFSATNNGGYFHDVAAYYPMKIVFGTQGGRESKK